MAGTQHPHIFSETGLRSLISQQQTGQVDLQQFTGVPLHWQTANLNQTSNDTSSTVYSQPLGSSSTLHSTGSQMADHDDSDFDSPFMDVPKLVSFATNKCHKTEMRNFIAFFPQLAEVLPFVIYIAIAAAFTSSNMVTAWPQVNDSQSFMELEAIARWAFTTIIALHSESTLYLPVEEGMYNILYHLFLG